MIFVPEVCVKEFSVLRSEFYDHMFSVNPYRQIPETISKKRVVTQGKLFPKSMILNKIWNFGNSGYDPGEFPETFSRYSSYPLDNRVEQG